MSYSELLQQYDINNASISSQLYKLLSNNGYNGYEHKTCIFFIIPGIGAGLSYPNCGLSGCTSEIDYLYSQSSLFCDKNAYCFVISTVDKKSKIMFTEKQPIQMIICEPNDLQAAGVVKTSDGHVFFKRCIVILQADNPDAIVLSGLSSSVQYVDFALSILHNRNFKL